MQISNELVFNIIQDWKKKDITPEQKKVFLEAYMKENKVGLRELARLLDVPHTTLFHWLNGKREKEEKSSSVKTNKEAKENELDELLDRLTFLLSRPFKPTKETMKKIDALQIELNKLELMPV